MATKEMRRENILDLKLVPVNALKTVTEITKSGGCLRTV